MLKEIIAIKGFSSKKGFTMLEILVALAVLGVISAVFFPIISGYLSNLRQAGLRNQQTIRSQGELNLGIAARLTTDFADIPISFVELAEQPIPINSGLIKSGELTTAITGVPTISLAPSVLDEGYPPLTIELQGNSTNFNQSTSLQIRDVDNNVIEGVASLQVKSALEAGITLQHGLTNDAAPYIIRLETPIIDGLQLNQAEVVRASLNLLLPRFISVGADGRLLVSANGANWYHRASPLTEDLNDIVWGNQEYMAVGALGSIIVLSDGRDWMQTAQTGLTADLNSINYNPDNGDYLLLGNQGTIVTVREGNWKNEVTLPVYQAALQSLNRQAAVTFDGLFNMMVTERPPLTGSTERTVFIVFVPETGSDLLLEWGSPGNNVDGGRWTLRTDNSNNRRLTLEIDHDAYLATDLSPVLNRASVVSCVLQGNTLADTSLFLNGKHGNVLAQANPGRVVNTQSQQGLVLGLQGWRDRSFIGAIGEVMVYNRALSAEDHDQVLRYLADRYALPVEYLVADPGPVVNPPTGPVLWLKGERIVQGGAQPADGERIAAWDDSSSADQSVDNDALAAGTVFNDAAWDNNNSLLIVGKQGWIINGKIDPASELYVWDTSVLSNTGNLNALSYHSQLWVAVGDHGLIITSQDRKQWTKRSSGISENLHDICWVPDIGLLIAVGEQGAIITSVDGYNWRKEVASTSQNLRSITYLKTLSDLKIVVAGDSDQLTGQDGIILTSEDGVNWTERESAVYYNLYGVATRR